MNMGLGSLLMPLLGSGAKGNAAPGTLNDPALPAGEQVAQSALFSALLNTILHLGQQIPTVPHDVPVPLGQPDAGNPIVIAPSTGPQGAPRKPPAQSSEQARVFAPVLLPESVEVASVLLPMSGRPGESPAGSTAEPAQAIAGDPAGAQLGSSLASLAEQRVLTAETPVLSGIEGGTLPLLQELFSEREVSPVAPSTTTVDGGVEASPPLMNPQDTREIPVAGPSLNSADGAEILVDALPRAESASIDGATLVVKSFPTGTLPGKEVQEAGSPVPAPDRDTREIPRPLETPPEGLRPPTGRTTLRVPDGWKAGELLRTSVAMNEPPVQEPPAAVARQDAGGESDASAETIPLPAPPRPEIARTQALRPPADVRLPDAGADARAAMASLSVLARRGFVRFDAPKPTAARESEGGQKARPPSGSAPSAETGATRERASAPGETVTKVRPPGPQTELPPGDRDQAEPPVVASRHPTSPRVEERTRIETPSEPAAAATDVKTSARAAGPPLARSETPEANTPAAMQPEARVHEARSLAAGALKSKAAADPQAISSFVLDNIAEKIPAEVFRRVRAGISEIRMQLQPDALGDLSLKVRYDEHGVTAQIQVTHGDVKAAMEANMPQLRDALAARGIEVQRIDVFAAGDAPAGESRGHQETRKKSQLKRRTTEIAEAQYRGARSLGYNTIEMFM
jgi:hypothetical protein